MKLKKKYVATPVLSVIALVILFGGISQAKNIQSVECRTASHAVIESVETNSIESSLEPSLIESSEISVTSSRPSEKSESRVVSSVSSKEPSKESSKEISKAESSDVPKSQKSTKKTQKKAVVKQKAESSKPAESSDSCDTSNLDSSLITVDVYNSNTYELNTTLGKIKHTKLQGILDWMKRNGWRIYLRDVELVNTSEKFIGCVHYNDKYMDIAMSYSGYKKDFSVSHCFIHELGHVLEHATLDQVLCEKKSAWLDIYNEQLSSSHKHMIDYAYSSELELFGESMISTFCPDYKTESDHRLSDCSPEISSIIDDCLDSISSFTLDINPVCKNENGYITLTVTEDKLYDYTVIYKCNDVLHYRYFKASDFERDHTTGLYTLTKPVGISGQYYNVGVRAFDGHDYGFKFL